MAEYLLKDRLKGRSDVEVLSAGTGVFMHASASSETLAVLQRRGIDASDHRAQPITSLLLHKADLILVMTRSHRQQVLEWAPEVENRVYQVREFDEQEQHGLDLDIPDPIGHSAETYEECIYLIERALKKVTKLI
jgi:protein-tyrosine phosphatase